MMQPLISVIIPVYNDNKRLEKCLKALTNQTINERFEVLVIDNDSLEDVQQVTSKFSEVTYLLEKKEGSYAARNRGVKYASGQILAFTDSDCVPDKDWLKNGLEFIRKNENCDVGGGKIELFFNSGYPNYIELYDLTFGFRQKKAINRHNYSVTANMFVKTQTFKRNGLFEEKLKSGGDVEWCRRIVKNGGNLCFINNAIIRHPALDTFKKFKKKYSRIAGGRYQKNNFNFYEICRNSYHHILSYRNVGKNIEESESIDSFSKKVRILFVHLSKIFIYILTYFKLYFGGKPER